MNSSMDSSLNTSYGSHQPEPLPFMPDTSNPPYHPVITPSPGSQTQSRYFRNDKETPEPIKANLPPPPPKTPFMCFSESKNDGVSVVFDHVYMFKGAMVLTCFVSISIIIR